MSAVRTSVEDATFAACFRAGDVYAPSSRLGLRAEGRVFIASWADARGVGLSIAAAIEELTQKLESLTEIRALHASDGEVMTNE